MDFIINLDTDIFKALNGLNAPFFDIFMNMFSGRYIWVPMYAAILLMVCRACNTKQIIVVIIGIAITISLTDQVCASVLRPIFERLRPSNLENPLSQFTHVVNGYRGGAYGFPSCHSANSFALVGFITGIIRTRKFTVAILLWAIINSYSRIYLGVHYPGDLLVGALVGGIIGWSCYRIVRSVAFRNGFPEEPAGDKRIFTIAIPNFRHQSTISLSVITIRSYTIFVTVALGTIAYIAVCSFIKY